MREFIAGLIALILLLVALSLIASLQQYRKRREAARRWVDSQGQVVIAELPTDSDLTLFSEGPDLFCHGDQTIQKKSIRGVQLLINGVPLATYMSSRFPEASAPTVTVVDAQFDGLFRDRWDVAIDTLDGVVMITCGAIRERVSQELGRQIYDAVRECLEARDAKPHGES